jgi:hypothetical protein
VCHDAGLNWNFCSQKAFKNVEIVRKLTDLEPIENWLPYWLFLLKSEIKEET